MCCISDGKAMGWVSSQEASTVAAREAQAKQAAAQQAQKQMQVSWDGFMDLS